MKMKTKAKNNTFVLLAGTALLAMTSLSPCFADEKDAKEVEAGARGGRLLDTATPRPEFFVEKDHTVSVKFYDEDKKVVTPTGQQVTVIATGEKKKKLTLEKKGDALVSTEPLPEGDGYGLVVQVRTDPDSRPENFRFTFANHICGGTCGNPEYACTCDE